MKNQNADEIFIYVLRLREGKYYVGQTNDLARRFNDHLTTTRGAEWTRMYRPLEIFRNYRTGTNDPIMAMKYENDHTFQCIKEFGWRNVRGGDFTDPDDTYHSLGLIKDSGLGNEVCPVPVAEGIDILKFERCVYTLELEGGNYFVSTTRNLNLAILNELNGRGAEWTKVYKPQKLIRVIPVRSADDFETQHLKELNRAFLKYQCKDVRGGIYNLIHPESHWRMVCEGNRS